jgi:hypothetical protein
MALDHAWKLQVAELLSIEEEPKAEKYFQPRLISNF